MKKFFIIATNMASPLQDEQIKNCLNSYSFSWWHWISNIWLVIDSTGKETHASLRDKIHAIRPHMRLIVLDVTSGTRWAGFGPISKDKDMFKWIRENWEKK